MSSTFLAPCTFFYCLLVGPLGKQVKQTCLLARTLCRFKYLQLPILQLSPQNILFISLKHTFILLLLPFLLTLFFYCSFLKALVSKPTQKKKNCSCFLTLFFYCSLLWFNFCNLKVFWCTCDFAFVSNFLVNYLLLNHSTSAISVSCSSLKRKKKRIPLV